MRGNPNAVAFTSSSWCYSQVLNRFCTYYWTYCSHVNNPPMGVSSWTWCTFLKRIANHISSGMNDTFSGPILCRKEVRCQIISNRNREGVLEYLGDGFEKMGAAG